MSQPPVGDIDQLGILVRVRGRERDRQEQAFIACARDHERRQAELQLCRNELISEEQRHEAALRLRASAPVDALLHDYLITRHSAIEALSRQELDATDAVRRTGEDLAQARSDHHRANVRLDVAENQLDLARKHKVKQRARKSDDASQEGVLAARGALL